MPYNAQMTTDIQVRHIPAQRVLVKQVTFAHTDPGLEPDTAKWQTEIYYPIALS